MNLNLSLRIKILLLVSTVMFVFLSTLMAALLFYTSRIEEEQLYSVSKIQTDLLAQSISQAMWDINTSYVTTSVEEALERKNIIRVTVFDDKDNIVVDKTTNSFDAIVVSPENTLTIAEPIKYNDGHNSLVLGVAKIVFSKNGIYFERNKLIFTFLMAGLLAMIVYLYGFYYYSRQFFEPINRIASTMLSLARGEIGIEVPYRDGNDEIGHMARAIQTFKKTAVSVDNLIHEISEREIIQEKLEITTELAKSANKAKSMFLANMSHEIRTPLNGVISTAELLIEDTLTPRQRRYVDIIQGSGRLLLTLLNDLLDISKIEAHKLEIHNDVFDLRNSVQVVYDLFLSTAEKKGIGLKLDVSPKVPQWVWGDGHRFQQILSNLVGNAVKYTSDGRILIKVQVKENMKYKDSEILNLHVEVIDSGIGIPADAIDTLFIRFSQAHKESSINGTGLGLAICQSLVDLMNGFIGVESQEGVGSNFWFILPLKEATAPQTSPKEFIEISRKIGNFGCRALLVEDIEVNRIVIGDMLEMLGCRVDTAVHGEDALNMLAKDKAYDIIFMDCNMPVMDGFEATKKIRELYGQELPIIAVSAHVGSEDIQNCFNVGMNGYVYKPVTKKSLFDAIQKWIKLDGQDEGLPVSEKVVDEVVTEQKAEAFNVQVLEEWLQNKPKLLTRFIDLTLKDADPLCADIKGAYADMDFIKIKSASHSLKSVSAQIGGAELSAICLSLEKASASVDASEVDRNYKLFEVAYTGFIKEIVNFRAKYKV